MKKFALAMVVAMTAVFVLGGCASSSKRTPCDSPTNMYAASYSVDCERKRF